MAWRMSYERRTAHVRSIILAVLAYSAFAARPDGKQRLERVVKPATVQSSFAELHAASAQSSNMEVAAKRAAIHDAALETVTVQGGGAVTVQAGDVTNRTANTSACVDPRVPLVKPITPSLNNLQWLHFPKAGTSFVSTIWTYACDRGTLALDLAVDATFSRGGCQRCFDLGLLDRYPRDAFCKDGVLHESFQTQHRPSSAAKMDNGENTIGLFRKPSQRIISAFHDGLHANGFSPESEQALAAKCKNGGGPACFARYPGIAGCMTRMLTGGRCAEDPATLSISDSIRSWLWMPRLIAERFQPSAVDDAVVAVHKMSFVGLTEEWDESVCLFHLMFGGPLRAEEFKDIHSNRASDEHAYDESVLDGFVDEKDEAVYAAARQRFYELRGLHIGNASSLCEAALGPKGARRLLKTAAGTSASAGACSCGELNAQCGATATGMDCGHCPPHRLPDGLRLQRAAELVCEKQQCSLFNAYWNGTYKLPPRTFAWKDWWTQNYL